MSTFNMESETRKSLYSAPEIEMVEIEANNAFLQVISRGDGDAGSGNTGGWD